MLHNTDDLIKNGNRCAIPWVHSQINLQKDKVTPCCKYNQNLGSVDSFIKIWRGEELQKLKYDIANNIHHPNCSACDVPEDVFSYRAFKNREFIRNSINAELDTNALPKVFNFSLKNTCNLACRMCSPFSSSKLLELSKKNIFLTQLYNYSEVNNKFDVQSLKGIFKDTHHVTISGGEPLIDIDCYDLLKLIREESKSLKSITFSTNFTKPSKNIIDLLKEIDCKIQLNISLDGPRDIHEYIRVGCEFNSIIDNITSNKNFSYGINSTLSVLNVGYIPEFLTSIRQIMDQEKIKFTHIMASPVLEDHLHVGNLPTLVKKLYIDKLANYKNVLTIDGSEQLIKTGLNLLSQDLPHWELTKKFLAEFDLVTKTSYKFVYPELAKF